MRRVPRGIGLAPQPAVAIVDPAFELRQIARARLIAGEQHQIDRLKTEVREPNDAPVVVGEIVNSDADR